MIFAAVNGVILAVSYSLGVIDETKLADGGGVGPLVGVSVAGIVLGVLAAYYLTVLIDKFALPILAAACAGIMIFVTLGQIKKIPKAVLYLTVALGAGLGFYFANKVQKFIKSAGTAIIGSFLLFRGIGNYVGNFPTILDGSHGADYD